MKKICVVTATRAEYGLLRNVIRRIQEEEELELCRIVTGTHLLNEYGNTIDEIIEDGFEIKEKIPILRSDVQGTDMMIQAMASPYWMQDWRIIYQSRRTICWHRRLPMPEK